MPKQLTLLLITSTQVARIDVVPGRRSKVKNLWMRDRIMGESTATLADAAIRLGPKKTGEVWVLSADFWTGVIHLAPDLARSLEGDELEQAIALEAETYSGISAFDSRLGIRSLPPDETGDLRWWVTQIAQSDWHDVKQTVAQFGGKLAGMGHAAMSGLPNRIRFDGSEQASWRLLQAFGEMTLGLQGAGSDVRDVITLGNLSTQRNRSQLNNWCGEGEDSDEQVTWVTDGPLRGNLNIGKSTMLSLTNENVNSEVVLSDSPSAREIVGEAAFQVWAESIGESLRADRKGNLASPPVAISETLPMSNQTATVVACGLGLVAAIGCVALYSASARQLEVLTAQVETLDVQKKKMSTDKKMLTASEKQLAEKKNTLADLQARTSLLQANLSRATRMRQFQQTRWLQLVTSIAKSHRDDLWVRGVFSDGQTVTVQGMAVSNQDVTEFTTKLEVFASPHGWKVHPAQTERNEMALVDFEVDLDVSDRVMPVTSADPTAVVSETTESKQVAQR
ncbi:PilN domain-containing protein [Roseiconus lacunae]|uniref:PilN domain-containing protein n=1 Tax=Roseiconus lacunae TaxID=2605694 RepID=UPI0011F12B44|nr:PilN domain-containing protein [Roseiconus lacunae]